jgi:hypothetical protein
MKLITNSSRVYATGLTLWIPPSSRRWQAEHKIKLISDFPPCSWWTKKIPESKELNPCRVYEPKSLSVQRNMTLKRIYAFQIRLDYSTIHRAGIISRPSIPNTPLREMEVAHMTAPTTRRLLHSLSFPIDFFQVRWIRHIVLHPSPPDLIHSTVRSIPGLVHFLQKDAFQKNAKNVSSTHS